MKKRISIYHLLSVLMILSLVFGINTCKGICMAAAKKTQEVVTIKGTGCNIDIVVSEKNKFSYKYDKKLFKVSVNKKGGTDIIVKAKDNKKIPWKDRVTIALPSKLGFSKLKVVAKASGISVCPINRPVNIINNKGAVSINIPKDISHKIDYSGTGGSGTILINKKAQYTFELEQNESAVSLPQEFTDYKPNLTNYQYTAGNGTSKINVKLKSSSLSVAIK